MNLLFPGYFCKFWRICDLISIYYLSVENWPCNLWIEIFDKLRICCWIWPKFCWGNYLWLFWLKSKLQFCKKITHVSCKVNVCFLPDILVSFFCDLLGASYLSVKKWPCSLWVEILVNFTFRSDQTFVMEIVVSYW